MLSSKKKEELRRLRRNQKLYIFQRCLPNDVVDQPRLFSTAYPNKYVRRTPDKCVLWRWIKQVAYCEIAGCLIEDK